MGLRDACSVNPASRPDSSFASFFCYTVMKFPGDGASGGGGSDGALTQAFERRPVLTLGRFSPPQNVRLFELPDRWHRKLNLP